MERPDYLWTHRQSYCKLAQPDGEHMFWTTAIADELPILMKSSGPASIHPSTMYEILSECAQVAKTKVGLKVFRNKEWVTYTWGEVHAQSLVVARALIHLGLPERTCTNIIGFNAPEWFLAYTGSVYANCIPVGVYTTNQTKACFYIADHCEAQVIFAQSEVHIQKYLPVVDKLPNLKAIVCYLPGVNFEECRRGRANIFTWSEFLALGTQQDDPMPRILNITPSSPVTIVYTSGTTGPPKGVLLSHDSCIYAAKTTLTLESFGDEHMVSFLPLSHTAAQYLDIFLPIVGRFTLTFADERALQGTLRDTLRVARPTIFLGVPRVFEKFEEALRDLAAKTEGVARSLDAWAKDIGYKATLAQLQGKAAPFGFSLANSLVLSKVKAALGFDRLKLCLVAAAPISKSTVEFFAALNIPVLNILGMSESSGPVTFNHPARNNIWSAGYALPGTEMKILDIKSNPVPVGTRGEICFIGRNKFLGYFKNAKETRQTIDRNGWVHSGDEGYVDAQGFLFITGRFKELIITAGGENIPPVIIENTIKEECKLISHALVIGEARKFVSALITLKNMPMPDGRPGNQLAPEAIAILQAAGSSSTTVSDAITDPKVHALVEKAIAAANKCATSRAQFVRKWKIIPKDFSVAGGELTPTTKLKRRVIAEMYKAEIDALYREAKL